MQSVDWILRLQQRISPEKTSRIVRALIHEPLAISAMQQDGFVESDLFENNSWTLADLALFSMGCPLRSSELSQQGWTEIDPGLRINALKAYELAHQENKIPTNLAEAGLLALALRERRKLTKSWHGLMAELTHGTDQQYAGVEAVWKAPLACLYTMVPDGNELCQSLLPRLVRQPGSRWISHILMANPIEDDERLKKFIGLMRKINLDLQAAWLRELKIMGEDDLAEAVSLALLEPNSELAKEGHGRWEPNRHQLDQILKEALEVQHKAELYYLSGQLDEAEELFRQVQEVTRTWLAGINVRLASLGVINGRDETVQETLSLSKALASKDVDTEAELILQIGNPYQAYFPLDPQSTHSTHPLLSILMGEEIAKAGDLEAGQQMAKEALKTWLGWNLSDPFQKICQISADWKPIVIVNALVNLGLEDQAIEFIQAVLKVMPVDGELHRMLFDLLQKSGNDALTLEAASIHAGLLPLDVESQRNLALLLNSTKRWNDAYLVWKRVKKLANTCQTSDLVGMAEACLEVNDLPEAINLCNEVLAGDGNQGQANGMLGRALLKTGQFQQAIQPLIKATAICPDNTQSWLDLADTYHYLGDNQKALETLRAASLAVNDSAEIYLALGETCLKAGLQAEALPSFRKAAQLKPDSDLAVLRLGSILFSLGHHSEAFYVLTEATSRWPENPDLAFIYGKVCLIMGDPDTAIAAFETSLLTRNPDVERYILLADTLVNGLSLMVRSPSSHNIHNLERANQVLETALSWMPEHHLGLILRGEVLIALGEFEAAFEIFNHLFEVRDTIEADIHWRFLAGLGQAAIKTSQPDLALRVLREAVQLNPEKIQLHQYLTQAFTIANLPDEALQQARLTLKMANKDEQNILWFADFMEELGETAEAVIAMQTITELAPEKPDYWLKRAGLELENGDLENSRHSLHTMLELEGLLNLHYRTAALTFLRMQDQAAAIACLDLAGEQSLDVTSDYLMEMVCLNFQLGRVEAAHEFCLLAINNVPNDGILRIMQADLFCSQENWQRALASLDDALDIWEKGHRTGEIGRWQRLVQSGWIDPAWMESANRLGMISLRKALIYQQMNEMDLAEQHLEFALQQVEKYVPAVYMLVDLKIKNQSFDQARELLANMDLAVPELDSLRLELAEQEGQFHEAEEMLRKAMIDRPKDFRMRILHAKSLTRKFDWSAANTLLDQLLIDFRARKLESTRWPITKDELLASHGMAGDGLRLVELALSLRRWNDAMDLAIHNSKTFNDPTANLQLMKVLAISAEQQLLAGELTITAHAPGKIAVSDQNQQLLASIVGSEPGTIYSNVNSVWIKRGRLAFENSEENFQELARIAETPEECAALMASLRRRNLAAKTIELAIQYPQHPEVLAELALAQIKTNPEDAQMTAEHLVEISPADPIHLAVLALTATKNGDWPRALEALENALQIWPEEPEWHAWAAEIAEKIGAGRARQTHLEQAFALQPNRMIHALALGKIYNANQQYAKAASILRRAIEITANHPEIWMELAKALVGSGEHREALECAGKAAEIQPEDLQPILLSGEIAMAMGKLDWALAYAQEAFKLSSHNESAILFLSKVLEKRGKPAESLALIQRSLVNHDQSEPLVFEQARLLRKINGAKAALPVLSRLTDSNNPSVQALSLLAQVQSDCGDLIGAEKSARRALEVNPEDMATNLLLGRLLHKAGQLDQSLIYLKLACQDGGFSLEALMELGQVYQARREYQAAMQVFEQAILQSPRDYRPYLAAGTILREAKDYRGSEAMFRRAAELAPGDVNIQRQLGAVVALNLVYESQEVKFSYGQH